MGNRCRRNSYAVPYHRHLLASIVIGVGAALFMGISLSAYTPPGGDESVAQEAIASADGILAVESRSIIVVTAPPEKAEIRQIRGTLQSGQTLSASLIDQGVSGEAIELVSRTLAPVFDFRRSQPGHSYLLEQEESLIPVR